MNIEHKLEPIEHWIVDGKAYRLATEADVGKEVYFDDCGFEYAMRDVLLDKLVKFCLGSDYPFIGRVAWRFAYIQDDSLLTPQRTPVSALGDGWFLLTAEDGEFKEGDKISSDANCRHWVPKSWPTYIKIGDWLRHDSECRAARYFGPVSSEPQEIQAKDARDTPRPIDWTKPVRTKDGRAVRVVCTDAPGTHPIIGIVQGVREPFCWEITGVYEQGLELGIELENVPQRIQREYWVNVYKDHIGGQCKTQAIAKDMRENGCLACVKITIDCEEGEGL